MALGVSFWCHVERPWVTPLRAMGKFPISEVVQKEAQATWAQVLTLLLPWKSHAHFQSGSTNLWYCIGHIINCKHMWFLHSPSVPQVS